MTISTMLISYIPHILIYAKHYTWLLYTWLLYTWLQRRLLQACTFVSQITTFNFVSLFRFTNYHASAMYKHHPLFSCFLVCPQSYTQYIPLSVYDLQTWMGSPSIFVYDCNNAGLILQSFNQFASQREQEHEVKFCKVPNPKVPEVPGS